MVHGNVPLIHQLCGMAVGCAEPVNIGGAPETMHLQRGYFYRAQHLWERSCVVVELCPLVLGTSANGLVWDCEGPQRAMPFQRL